MFIKIKVKINSDKMTMQVKESAVQAEFKKVKSTSNLFISEEKGRSWQSMDKIQKNSLMPIGYKIAFSDEYRKALLKIGQEYYNRTKEIAWFWLDSQGFDKTLNGYYTIKNNGDLEAGNSSVFSAKKTVFVNANPSYSSNFPLSITILPDDSNEQKNFLGRFILSTYHNFEDIAPMTVGFDQSQTEEKQTLNNAVKISKLAALIRDRKSYK
jgi:hypothetical protein